jgi:hypothetical protein
MHACIESDGVIHHSFIPLFPVFLLLPRPFSLKSMEQQLSPIASAAAAAAI